MNSKWYLVLVLVIALLLSLTAYAGPPKEGPSCDLTLQGCVNLVKAEDAQILHLKQDVKELEKKLNQEADPLVPWWGWAALGAVAGGVGGYLLHK